MNSNSGSVTSLDLVRIWDQTCLKKHKCKIEQSVLPTRVIDVGPRDGSQVPFLHVTKGEMSHWISLSHCWGKRPIAKTELANFESMCRGITLQRLPKTFQDSVILTRQLGIRYLWIDSICIIQDSPADWETEAAKMADIYKKAYLTVVAASAKDSGWTPQYGQRISTIVDTRAWCLQEEALSPRLLKYNRTHMSWHCSDWADIHEDGRQKYHYDNWYRIPATLELADDGKRRHIWHMILTNYTKRHMTFGKDKLPALAGVATEFHQRTGDEYLAGMWRSQLPLGLMWRTRLYDHGLYDADEVPQHERSAKYRAPSWSWACVDGPMDFSICTSDLPYDSETSITILNFSITTKSTGPFGEVLAGSLSVRGKLKVAECGNDIIPPRGKWGEDAYYTKEIIDPSSSLVDSRAVGQCLFDLAAEKPASQSRLWCLQISALRGLVLMPNGEGSSEFRRVGLFRLTDHGAWFEGCSMLDITIL
ncbi:HET-domain-containing protein [Lepidopterella palustris CBS 459.81]|uniref:HET-domain-containing protein n=1 Tax=Lepidopterella palustris CBS 459.81 TaxID=1314670 RepID=A0A8E2JIR1_9PEZI|nr:HET-domain-containing protein [Lepidopterella palustris CBS 459.81]